MDWQPLLLVCIIGGVLGDKQPQLRPVYEAVEKSQNESYVVMCSMATENNEVPKLTWTGPKGKPIPASGRVHTETRGSHGIALFLDPIEVADQGRYTCTTETKETASFELSVIQTSKFVNTPSEHHVKEFHDTIIRCEVVGHPKPFVTWQKNGVSVDTIQDRKPGYVADPKGLRIVNASKEDAGVFTCRALQAGKADNFIQSVDIILKVQHKPEWKEPVTGEVVAYGYVTGETNLTCEALAQPEANYTWLSNNKNIKSLKLNATEILEQDRSVLQILIHDDSVFGKYQCQAKNHLGYITKTFDLQKGEKPEPPTGLRNIDSTEHTTTLKIASDVTDLIGYRVQFVVTRPGQEVNWDHPEFQDLPKTESGHYIVHDLLEDTPYTVRVASRGQAGLSDYTTTTILIRTRKAGEVESSAVRRAVQLVPLLVVLAALAAVH